MQTPTTYRVAAHILFTAAISHKRKLARSKDVERWSMTTMREKPIKVATKVVRHCRFVTFQLAEVAVPRSLFQKILGLIDDLRRRPRPA
jgi:hypothetical protein